MRGPGEPGLRPTEEQFVPRADAGRLERKGLGQRWGELTLYSKCSGSFCKVAVRRATWSDLNGGGSHEPRHLWDDHAQCCLSLSHSLSWSLASFAPRVPLGGYYPALSRAQPCELMSPYNRRFITACHLSSRRFLGFCPPPLLYMNLLC